MVKAFSFNNDVCCLRCANIYCMFYTSVQDALETELYYQLQLSTGEEVETESCTLYAITALFISV